MDPSSMNIQKEADDGGVGAAGSGGGGGNGDSDPNGNPSMRAGGANAPPLSHLVLVGKILDNPPPEYQAASGGRMMKIAAEVWMTDLYRCNQWWIVLPNVEDVGDVNRRRLMMKTLPLGAPQTSSLVGVADGSQGRMRMEGMKLALFDGSSGREAWNMLSGTPPAWFANAWDKSKRSGRECPTGIIVSEEMRHSRECNQLANEFKNGKIYVTKDQVLQLQRDWLVV